jgi:hypothetical protein
MRNTQIRKFNEWASSVYENRSLQDETLVSFFDKGDADPRSLFECLLSSVNNSVNEALESLEFDFNEVDSWLAVGIAESLRSESEEPINEVFNSIKKSISTTIDGAKDLMNKGIQIGADLYKSVEEIGSKLNKAVSKVFEKVKELLKRTWEWAKSKSKNAITKVKDFVKEEAKGVAMSSLASVLSSKSAEAELKEAPKDINAAVSKISGKTYNLNPTKGAEDLKDFTKELEDAKDDEIDDLVIGDLSGVSESTIHNIFTSLKGFILGGYSLDEVFTALHEEDLNENSHDKKGLIGWLIEAIGFALDPFAKLYETAIKAGSNGAMIVVSSIARGGVKNSYKYVVMGTIVSLTYHIIHGMTAIASHFGEHGEEMKSAKISDTEKMLDPKDAAESLSSMGKVFLAAAKHFLPYIALVMEIVITAIASFELLIAFCESTNKENAVCSIVMKIEHNLEAIVS